MTRRSFFLFFLMVLTACPLLRGQGIDLSNTFVLGVDADAEGRIWAATMEGLNCYDGIRNREFLTYNSEISANYLNDVLCDRTAPLVWAATRKMGLVCYDTESERFTTYHADAGNPSTLLSDDITHIFQDEEGRIWLSTFTEGIERFDREKGTFVHYNASTVPGFHWGRVQRFLVQDDCLYLGYWEDGLGIISLKDGTAEYYRHDAKDPSSLPSDEVRALFLDPHGNLWVGTTAGLALLNRSGKNFTVFRHDPSDPHSLPDGAVYAIDITQDDRLLVGTDQGGVCILDLKGALFFAGKVDFGQLDLGMGLHDSQVSVRSFCYDYNGNLWIGTAGMGLIPCPLSPPGTRHLRYPYHLSASNASALALSPEGNLLVGLQSGTVDVLDARRRKPQPLDLSLSGSVQALCVDRDGCLWAGSSDDGVLAVSPRKRMHSRLGQESLMVYTFLEDADTMWIGSGSGLFKLSRKDGRVLRHYGRVEGLADNIVYALERDREGRLWVGTYGRGLIIFSGKMDSLTRYDLPTGFFSNSINDLYSDTEGRTWVATSDGLARFDWDYTSVSRVYTRRDGLSNDNIRALAQDAEGNLWMSTHNGISCLTREGIILNYDERDGLPDGNYLGGAVAVSRDGTLFFGNTDGVAWINPPVLLARKELPPVVFRTKPSDLSVSYKDGPLTVEFCVPDYVLASQVEYSYRIPKIDDEWRECSNQLTFNQLPHGNYNLEVRARLRNQGWDGAVSSIPISVEPPFWKGRWGWLLYLALAIWVVTMVVLLERRRTRKKIERERLLQNQQVGEERMLFYTNVTHELRTPLTLIIGPLDDLAEDPELSPSVKERIGRVNQSAHQLLGLINQLLEFRKTETRNRKLSVTRGNLSTFVEDLFARFSTAPDNPQVSYVSQVEPDLELYFDPDALTLILNNLLSNAVKYTPKGQITLSARREDPDHVVVRVQDTGYGIPDEAIPHLFDRYYQAGGANQATGFGIGLSLVKGLCDLHKIAIRLSSQVGEGTTFTLTMDARETYPEADHVEPASEVVRARTVPEPVPDESKPLVLVVEDNSGICDFIRESLEEEFRVSTAHNGKEGLAIALKQVPDIIISDIMMPVMDGIQLCRAVKNDMVTSHIPVILLTAKSSVESRKEGYDVGADSYIVKPFNRALLVSRIQNILTTRSRLAKLLAKGESPQELSTMDNSFIHKFTEAVEASIQENSADVESLAEKLCMSPSTLYRKVKGLTGIPPNEFIRNIKLDKAARLLIGTDMTVAEIAFQCGMGSPVYFRNCFKERFGKTPTEYRNG